MDKPYMPLPRTECLRDGAAEESRIDAFGQGGSGRKSGMSEPPVGLEELAPALLIIQILQPGKV
jgi:hypothetical protein